MAVITRSGFKPENIFREALVIEGIVSIQLFLSNTKQSREVIIDTIQRHTFSFSTNQRLQDIPTQSPCITANVPEEVYAIFCVMLVGWKLKDVVTVKV